ncbi:hypothetical protein LOAG_08063 [Loa loa]|uniref:Uncharacterized protein n=1 Tax=Loa loa TaxID=7209 RepID=A0A1S0TV83_LOALO|nr:hypothetical protein LOAG_08063 [Loa loa]EFO20427.1 hypothetical protein LOAG_08063 [Loa loa]
MELQCWGIVLSVIEVPNGEVSAITETDGQTDRYMVIEEWSRRRRDSGWICVSGVAATATADGDADADAVGIVGLPSSVRERQGTRVEGLVRGLRE